MTANITHIILDAADKCIPNKIITVRKDQPPWLTNEIKKKIRKKNRIHKTAKRRDNSKDWNKFKKIRNEVTNLVRKSKEDFNNSLIKKVIDNNSSNKNWWKIVNQITGMKSRDTSIPPLLINDSLIFDDIDKANELNDFFASQSNIDDSSSILPVIPFNASTTINEIELNETEVEDILSIINPPKASGPDLINPKLLKRGFSYS
ncbi:unnamed protein product [Mytilus coruscus]|uniref:Reverse transcriptase domain-containing protein n=1 Tax=Mytilus coruscus TaxID=42192 RepID=A0A6J8AZV6_MYTCO|nr:unnamed protein product [Mytilus coruscus]